MAHCCGIPAPAPNTAPVATGWDLMSTWYISSMSTGTSALAISLMTHLGLLGDETGLSVIETHCGNAQAAAALLPLKSVAGYTACDFSEMMVQAARARMMLKVNNTMKEQGLSAALAGFPVRVMQADSTDLPVEAASFDRYLSNLGCCCVSNLDAKLAEAYRVLKPGGRAAMSMRIEKGVGDTSFALIADALEPFGFPAGADREGLHIGKDLGKVREKVERAGFVKVVAWRTFVTLPVHDAPAFVEFAMGQPPVHGFVDQLECDVRGQALAALEAAAANVLEEVGVFQMAAAAFVAYK